MASEVVCKFVLIDVPSDFFNKVFGPANIVVVKSALQSDTWGPVASLCEFTDVAIDDLRGVADRITFEARIKLDSEAKKDATVRSLRNYVNDRFKCFRGASSVIRAEVPSAHPSALLRECFIDGAPVEEPPKPQEVRRAPTPPPAPVREHLTSPSREQHVNTHVRDSHIVALNDVHMYERERRPRPPGGFKVDDLILGYLPPMNKSASTSARRETSRERDAYLGVELSRRHGYGPSQRVHHDDQRYDYIDVTADDGADYREDRWSVRPSPSSHRGHFSPAPTHPAAAGHRASSTRRVVVMDEPDASRRGRQGTPGRHAYPADAVADDGAYRQPRRSEFERDVRRAPDEFLRGSSRPKTREVVDADDNLRARSSSRSSRHGVGYESVGRRYTTRGGQDMPRRF